ncbi:general substrate transporter [Aureobasidium pullulans]|uniref:General substrate transporter n=1 Tax=Aureobasidium pullulans TaxID=5580 RepID=A0A4S8ZTQ8_AURPU|nr:general substrate transporter [Aureobasidium pullulans]
MTMDEKYASQGVEKVDTLDSNEHLETIEGSTAFSDALLREHPTLLSPTTLLLFGCTLLGCLCQTMNGYDGSLLNGLLANPQFKTFFHGSNDGIWAGLVSAMYQIGGVVALPFVGPAIDTWGRRYGMFIGAFVIMVGTIVSGTTFTDGNVKQFMGGRFLLGFGVSIASSAGPIYVVEMSHPAYRGKATAYCNCFWFTGSIIAAGAVRGALNLSGNTSWLVPVWIQMACPLVICLFVWFIPESPRWLYVNNKQDTACATLTKWHGQGNADSAWVKLQLAEYEECLNMDGADKRYWDYSALFKKRSSRYRLACNCAFSCFGQWAGNAVLTYFIAAVLDTAGYTQAIDQTNINLGYACFQFVFALIGSAFVDKIGRRKLMIGAMTGCAIVWVGMTTASGLFKETENSAAAKATVAMIFMFGAVFSFGITPLQALFPVEVLSFEMRAKGMAFSSLSVNAGGLLNQFAWPVSLKSIGWKTYIIFIVWCTAQAAIMYFFFPETRNRTLEELDAIFEAPNPVKKSLEKKQVIVSEQNGVSAIEKVVV